MENESFRDSGLWKWWKNYGEHFTAPLILIALIILGYQLYVDDQLKENISENCGWGKDDYQCYCVRSQYENLKAQYEGTIDLDDINFGDNNATLD